MSHLLFCARLIFKNGPYHVEREANQECGRMFKRISQFPSSMDYELLWTILRISHIHH